MSDSEIFLLSSSSSSSSSDEERISVCLNEILYSRTKNENYFETIVPQYTDQQYLEHFRISKHLSAKLSTEFEASHYYSKSDTGFDRIPAQKCIAIFCWYAGHEAAGFRDVADRFNISISTLHQLIEKVVYFLSYKSPSVIKWPNETEKRENEKLFKENGFFGAIGCIDGTHIKIDKQSDDPDSYLNRKKYYSIQAQVVCDSTKRIIDVFIGYPGSVHDSRVFTTSPLYNNLAEKCGDYYILGDSAYPCLKSIMTPYRDNGHLNPTEKNYNYKFSQSRIRIEHVFGIVKQKFRQLYHLKLQNINTICHFIRACFVLYNLSLDDDVNIDDVNEECNGNDNMIMHNEDDDENEGDDAGKNFRNYIAAVLYNIGD
ncbi:putative nuclease HARBI1 [Onthophagus taurus]|uniref:putative nuclease HARBI1 n=1 Tax=Onthophagus taurus TaxID=166361 RepID=UPI0039BE0697